jgi:hypothetical protein
MVSAIDAKHGCADGWRMISYLPGETTGEVPLEAATWRMLLGELGDDLTCSGPADEVARLREAYVLLARAPSEVATVIGALPPREAFATWLADDACASAALALLGDRAGYLVSRGGDSRHLATLVLACSGEEHSAAGATLALALIAALTAALLALTGAEPQRAFSGSRLLH